LPPTPGTYVIEHVALLTAFPGDRAQVAEDGEKVPVEFVTKLTVPVGVDGFDEESSTVAVHLVDDPSAVRVLGEHCRLTLAGARVATRPNTSELVWCAESAT